MGTATPGGGNETRQLGSAHKRTNDLQLQRYPNSYRIQQSVLDLLSVTVAETGAAELTPNPNALRVTTVGLGVNRLLAALVASGSLKIHSKKAISQKLVARAFLGLKETHCWAVVHFLAHVVADVLQLCLCDVIHRSHYMGNRSGTAEGTAALLKRKTNCCLWAHTLTEAINWANAFNHVTYWLIIFLIVAAFADQAELVLRLFLWSWAGGSLHQGAGPCVRPGGTWRGPPAGSRGLPRCLAWLLIWYQLLWIYSTRAAKNKLYFCIKGTVVDADTAIRLGKSPGTLFSSAISFAS